MKKLFRKILCSIGIHSEQSRMHLFFNKRVVIRCRHCKQKTDAKIVN